MCGHGKDVASQLVSQKGAAVCDGDQSLLWQASSLDQISLVSRSDAGSIIPFSVTYSLRWCCLKSL